MLYNDDDSCGFWNRMEFEIKLALLTSKNLQGNYNMVTVMV